MADVFVRTWDHADPKRVVVLVHGYGEHIGRYEHVAAALADDGAVVWGNDHRGHGRSEGDRAVVEDFEDLVDDLHASVVVPASEANPGLPVVMVGHSMGGMIATRYAQRHGDRLTALVISGALLGEPALLAQLLALPEIPDIPIDPSVLSRDESVGQAYADDPLVWHGPFQRPTVEAFVVFLKAILDEPEAIAVPVLWQHGADDQLVNEAETRPGIEALRARGADIKEIIYPGARHEIFNETNQDEVLADTREFVTRVA